MKSHACGTGPEVPREIVLLMMYLKIQSLSYGYSGVQVETVERLIGMFNERVLPRIYEMGSLGKGFNTPPSTNSDLPSDRVNTVGMAMEERKALNKLPDL